MANAVRLATFTPALELATVELMMAKKTSTQNRPYSALATPSQDAAPVPVVKVANFARTEPDVDRVGGEHVQGADQQRG